MQIPEYDLQNTDSLTVLTESDVGDARWFRKELIRIAGKNPHGRGNLELRWGPTYEDPMAVDRNIKYLDFSHEGVQLGERRWFIEIWRSPEFLEKSGRYKVLGTAEDGQLLKEFPVEGCYDYWLRLERANLTYHPLDDEAVQVCRALWQWEQTPQNVRDALEQADREHERRQAIKEKREQRNSLWGFERIIECQ